MNKHKILQLTIAATVCLTLSACTTYIDQYGQTRQGLTPAGAAVIQGAVATGVGVATGALMGNGQNSLLVGGASGAAGSVASQLVNAFLPTVPQNQMPYSTAPAPQYRPTSYQTRGYAQNQQRYSQAQPAYQPVVAGNQNNGETLYRRLPNGQLVEVY